MEILRVEHLVKTYGQGENQVRAVDDMSFTIDKGEFVAIVGVSGRFSTRTHPKGYNI